MSGFGINPPSSEPTPRDCSIMKVGMGWEVSFSLLYGGVGRRGHLLRGGWSHSPPVGEGGDVDGSVSCVWVVGMEGCFVDGFVLVGDTAL